MGAGDNVTQWLQLWRDGDEEAIERVTALVYQDLRRLAAYHLEGESNANTLQPTELVHEAYLRMSSIRQIDWKGRGHFISLVTQIMRRILVDHARARNAAKRDSGAAEAAPANRENSPLDILAIDQALGQMAEHHPRCSKVVDFRFYMHDVDASQPVYPIRGSYQQYQCNNPKTSVYKAGQNCSLSNIPKASGVCYKTTFGDWTCTIASDNPSADVVQSVQRNVPGPRYDHGASR